MKNQNFCILITLFAIGLAFRVLFLPFDVPIATDSFDAFIYASKITQEGQLPQNFNTGNTGWQYLISFFFGISDFDKPLELMNTQRLISSIISGLVIFPLYVLLRRFFNEKFAFIGCILFIFEPRFLIISILGVNYPFFILLTLISLVAFLQNKKNFVYVTFVCIAIASLVRVESMLFIPFFSILYLIKNRNKREIFRLTSAMMVLVLILLPVSLLRIDANEQDGLISQFITGPTYISKHVVGNTPDENDLHYNTKENKLLDFIFLSISNFSKFFGLVLIPYFLVLCGIGLFFIFKHKKYRNIDYDKITIILFSLIIIVPSFYAYGRGISEVRYLIGLLPIFSIIATYGIYVISSRMNRKNIIPLSTIVVIIIISVIFIDLKIPDQSYEKASYFISTEIIKRTDVVNNFEGDWHLKSAYLINNWPNLPEANQVGKYSIIINKIDVDEYGNFEEFLMDSKTKKLEYVVVSNRGNMIEFEKYPFLIEEINSHDYGYNEKFQIFKIVNSKRGE